MVFRRAGSLERPWVSSWAFELFMGSWHHGLARQTLSLVLTLLTQTAAEATFCGLHWVDGSLP